MSLLYLIVLCPILGFLTLAISQNRWPRKIVTAIGVGSIGLSVLLNIWIALDFFRPCNHDKKVFAQYLWQWIAIDNFRVPITFVLDNLSLIMISITSGIGFLIHLYASWYIPNKAGYSRFFAYTNLFIASMFILVMADNLLLMYLGWELVGLCSYLLIGFNYKDHKNNDAAMKAFFVTRVGDIMLLIALFILYNHYGTLNLNKLILITQQTIVDNYSFITCATFMMLIGAIGKSAQLPLHTWLADAMAGPTPVSALIHSATMVNAGVYLIVRTKELFILTPDTLCTLGVLGALTLLTASLTALVQNNVKKILAYSTMGQIGYMFVAMGVQNWNAAVYHMTIHAIFKALLFLASGSLIVSCHNEQNIFKMGGLKSSLPLIYTCFIIGGASLSALPLVTSGFYSKSKIICGVIASNNIFLMSTVLVGVLLTSIYTFRMICSIFHGKLQIQVYPCVDIRHHVTLITLTILSTFIGPWVVMLFNGGLSCTNELDYNSTIVLEFISGMISIIGAYLTIVIWSRKPYLLSVISTSKIGRFFSIWWLNDWGFNWLYNKIFIEPFLAIAQLLKPDLLSKVANSTASLVLYSRFGLRIIENGKIRWYAMSLSLGAATILMLLLLYKKTYVWF